MHCLCEWIVSPSLVASAFSQSAACAFSEFAFRVKFRCRSLLIAAVCTWLMGTLTQ